MPFLFFLRVNTALGFLPFSCFLLRLSAVSVSFSWSDHISEQQPQIARGEDDCAIMQKTYHRYVFFLKYLRKRLGFFCMWTHTYCFWIFTVFLIFISDFFFPVFVHHIWELFSFIFGIHLVELECTDYFHLIVLLLCGLSLGDTMEDLDYNLVWKIGGICWISQFFPVRILFAVHNVICSWSRRQAASWRCIQYTL